MSCLCFADKAMRYFACDRAFYVMMCDTCNEVDYPAHGVIYRVAHVCARPVTLVSTSVTPLRFGRFTRTNYVQIMV